MSGPTGGDAVQFDAEGRVAVITLNRPHVRNAIDRLTAEAIGAALDRFESDPDLWVGVLAGSGGVFCAGMDLKALRATGERPVSTGRGLFGICGRPPAKPIVAAVEGNALGGGCEIVLACDLIVAAENASFGLPEVRRGLVAGAGGVLRLPRRIPRSVAMELVLTGEPIAAPRAAELGLVNQIVPAGSALAEAKALAARIAANAPLAVRTGKLLIDQCEDVPLEEAFRIQAPHLDAVRASRDASEGVAAFTEKRAPVWAGR